MANTIEGMKLICSTSVKVKVVVVFWWKPNRTTLATAPAPCVCPLRHGIARPLASKRGARPRITPT
jgi:hypothetical protein